MMTFKDFENEFNNLSTNEQIEIFNKFSDKHNLQENFYEMSSLDDLLAGNSPLEVLGSLAEGFDHNKQFIQLDGYGKYQSHNTLDVRLYIQESGYMSEIFEEENIWYDKIDSTEYEEDEEDED